MFASETRGLALSLLIVGWILGAQACSDARADDRRAHRSSGSRDKGELTSRGADASTASQVEQSVTLCDVGYAEVLRELATYGRCAEDEECVAVPLNVAAAVRHRELITRVQSTQTYRGWLVVQELGAATNSRWLRQLESSLRRYRQRCESSGSLTDVAATARCVEGMCVPVSSSPKKQRTQ